MGKTTSQAHRIKKKAMGNFEDMVGGGQGHQGAAHKGLPNKNGWELLFGAQGGGWGWFGR